MTRQVLTLRLVLEFAVIVVSALFIIESMNFTPSARYAPFFSAGLAVAALLIAFVRDARRLAVTIRQGQQDYAQAIEYMSEDETVDGAYMLRGLRYVAWLLAYFVAILLLGSYIASAAFLGLFLWREAKRGPVMIIVGVCSLVLVLWLAETELHMMWTEGALTGL